MPQPTWIDKMVAKVDRRLQCKFCKARTWMTDYKAFMRDHDRPQGGRCLRARGEMAILDASSPNKMNMPPGRYVWDGREITLDQGIHRTVTPRLLGPAVDNFKKLIGVCRKEEGCHLIANHGGPCSEE